MNHWVCVSYHRVASHWWSNELPFQFIRWSEKKDLMVTYPEATILILTWSQFDFNSLWWYLYSGLTRFSGIAYCIFLNNSKKRDGRYHYVNDPARLYVYKKIAKMCVQTSLSYSTLSLIIGWWKNPALCQFLGSQAASDYKMDMQIFKWVELYDKGLCIWSETYTNRFF